MKVFIPNVKCVCFLWLSIFSVSCSMDGKCVVPDVEKNAGELEVFQSPFDYIDIFTSPGKKAFYFNDKGVLEYDFYLVNLCKDEGNLKRLKECGTWDKYVRRGRDEFHVSTPLDVGEGEACSASGGNGSIVRYRMSQILWTPNSVIRVKGDMRNAREFHAGHATRNGISKWHLVFRCPSGEGTYVSFSRSGEIGKVKKSQDIHGRQGEQSK